MRVSLAAIAIAFLLSACQTTSGQNRNLVVQKGNGGATLNVCVGDFAFDHIFTLTIERVADASNERDLDPSGAWTQTFVVSSVTAPNKHPGSMFEPGMSCKFWDFEAAPGTYAITRLRERYYDPYPRGGLLYVVLKAAAAAVRDDDEIVFLNEHNSLKSDAPVFDIRNGEVSDLGTLIFVGERTFREHPVKDPNGYWDGQTTEQVEDRRVLVRYEMPGATASDSVFRDPNGKTHPLTPQSLTVLENITLILEDFPEVGSAVQ
ncbi:hypothetical protein NUH88_07760 [Nisaea acidiphila]|uniref:DUF4198 domain-containing protein n=1 Tax=Nisaea acidiphila TaxID=1862145 RepID=A0A9J7AWA3_9PROT|nr:hypothetical protein [Nisaea acidiphila]UUX51584.1 hypothetical protein NUH88_07760 [Nisaea acidiphila]